MDGGIKITEDKKLELVLMKFGKWENRPFKVVPDSYFNWVYKNKVRTFDYEMWRYIQYFVNLPTGVGFSRGGAFVEDSDDNNDYDYPHYSDFINR